MLWQWDLLLIGYSSGGNEMNKKSQLGFGLRILASILIGFSLPLLIIQPQAIFNQVLFALGNFLMIIGGLIK